MDRARIIAPPPAGIATPSILSGVGEPKGVRKLGKPPFRGDSGFVWQQKGGTASELGAVKRKMRIGANARNTPAAL